MSLTTWDPDAFLHITTNLLRKYRLDFFLSLKLLSLILTLKLSLNSPEHVNTFFNQLQRLITSN